VAMEVADNVASRRRRRRNDVISQHRARQVLFFIRFKQFKKSNTLFKMKLL